MTAARRHAATCLSAVLLLSPAGPVAAQARCPGYDVTVEAAWARYRAADIRGADSLFAVAFARCPAPIAARIGLGYTALRSGRSDAARIRFEDVLRQEPGAEPDEAANDDRLARRA